MALTGDPVSAERAAKHGLVNQVVAPGEATTAALERAERIAANAPLAVRAALRVLRDTVDLDDDAAFELTAAAADLLAATADAAEGPRAFIEKRTPLWTGR